MKTVSLPYGVKGYVLYQDNELSCIQTDGVTAGPFSDIFSSKRDISEYDIRTKKFKEELIRNKLIVGNLFMPDFDLFSTKEHDILSQVARKRFNQKTDYPCAWLGVESDSHGAWCVDSYGNVINNYHGYSYVVAPAFISKTKVIEEADKKNNLNKIQGFECERFGAALTKTKVYDVMLDGSDKRAAEEAWKCFHKISEENPELHIKLTTQRGGSKIELLF